MSDNTDKNHAHWNDAASTYNTRFSKTIQQIIDQIRKHHEWLGVDWVEDSDSETEGGSSAPKKTVRLLDYACGTGLVSRALAPYITQAVGIDLTIGMVNEYNTAATNQGLSSSEMHAIQGNLLDPSSPSPPELSGVEFFNFDIAVVGMGFHHFDDPALAANRLAERLKKGGVLMIIDFLPHEHVHGSGGHSHGHGNGHSHGHGHAHGGNEHEHEHASSSAEPKGLGSEAAHTVTHMGFSEGDIKKIFEDAGVGKAFDYKLIGKGVVFEVDGKKMDRSVFFAKGAKL